MVLSYDVGTYVIFSFFCGLLGRFLVDFGGFNEQCVFYPKACEIDRKKSKVWILRMGFTRCGLFPVRKRLILVVFGALFCFVMPLTKHTQNEPKTARFQRKLSPVPQKYARNTPCSLFPLFLRFLPHFPDFLAIPPLLPTNPQPVLVARRQTRLDRRHGPVQHPERRQARVAARGRGRRITDIHRRNRQLQRRQRQVAALAQPADPRGRRGLDVVVVPKRARRVARHKSALCSA
ncbi:hypothetical protein PUMCH_004577 [Australozyma saopauloensis]|uniref:Transmembrane protein n=1 Tax=Australozyma saopauloensis TaxID=291208 RepID=A0AAX4HF56_9ASCO|nr:hypothetical protein PUMCH_004577 [[Candida] saopauloensis]